VNVGPLECMPTKIAEAQLHHIAEREGLLSLTLPLNGDPVSEAALDNFAFEVRARFQRRKNGVRRLEPGSAAAKFAAGRPLNQPMSGEVLSIKASPASGGNLIPQ